MNQALNPSSIRFHELVEFPSPAIPAVPIAKPLNGHMIEAVPCSVSDQDTPAAQAYYKGRWLVVETDPVNNLIRESTASYADERAAYYAYWYACADDPLDFEAWVSPLFATFMAVA